MIAGGGGHRRVPQVDGAHRRDRPEREGAPLRARARPGEAGALPEHGDHARRQGRDHGRVDRLPRQGRQRPCCSARSTTRSKGDITRVADPTVGRNYHAEALLLPDGRVITMGSDPLFSDVDEHESRGRSRSASRSTRRRTCSRATARRSPAGRRRSTRGDTVRFGSPDAGAIRVGAAGAPERGHARDRPGAAFGRARRHARNGGGVDLTIPKSAGLVPSGWYMLFVSSDERPALEGPLGACPLGRGWLAAVLGGALVAAAPASAATFFKSPSAQHRLRDLQVGGPVRHPREGVGAAAAAGLVPGGLGQRPGREPARPRALHLRRATRSSAASGCWPTARRSAAAASSARAAATACAA